MTIEVRDNDDHTKSVIISDEVIRDMTIKDTHLRALRLNYLTVSDRIHIVKNLIRKIDLSHNEIQEVLVNEQNFIKVNINEKPRDNEDNLGLSE